MLKGELFDVLTPVKTTGGFEAMIKIHPDHPVFDGHFPSNPVLPGVCMIEILRESVSMFYDRALKLTGATEVKYPAMLLPGMFSEVSLKVSFRETDNSDEIHADAVLASNDTVFMKVRNAAFH